MSKQDDSPGKEQALTVSNAFYDFNMNDKEQIMCGNTRRNIIHAA